MRASATLPMTNSEPIASAAWCEQHRRGLLIALLAISLGLRVWLAATGGQGYWPDEMRYSSASREAAWQFAHGTPRDAWLALIGTADHLLFKIAGLPAAYWELKFGHNGTLVASWFGFFSVLAIALIYAIARAAGAAAREALLAAFFAAGASSLFYYCRHFFPYDLSLFFCLLATWLALGPAAWWRSGVAGLAAGLGFLSYNGYWLLGGVVLAFHVLAGGDWRRMVGRALLAGVGLAAPIAAAIWAARSLGRDLIASFREFSGTITQGDFGHGWSLVGEYLWSAEGVIVVAWVALMAAGLSFDRSRRRIVLWLGFVAALYLGLVVCSDVLRTFVVYGRTARIVVPFLCLGAAAGAEGLAARWPRREGWALLLTFMFAGAAWNMGTPLRQVFPDGFLRAAKLRAQIARAESSALLRVLNASRLGEGYVMSEPRPHAVLLRRTHPLQFAPFLYEGFSAERRRRFRTDDISMQLIAVPSVTLPDIGGGYPGPLRLRIKFPTNRSGVSEPLLTSGEPGRADFIYVQYLDERHIRVGYDCWNVGGPLGSPVAIDLTKEHEVLVSSCAQLPPSGNPPDGLESAAWRRLQGSVFVAIDGEVVLMERVATNRAAPNTLFVGTNVVGGSTAREGFSGEVRGIERLGWNEVLKRLEVEALSARELTQLVASASPGPAWIGYCGPLRLKLRFPHGVAGQAEPLVVTGTTGKGDFVYVRYLADGRVSFGFDHWGIGGAESAPVALNETRRAEVMINFGAMMPPIGAGIYATNPGLADLRQRVAVTVDGRIVFSTAMASHPAAADAISVGRNLIGGSTTAAQFSGEIFSVDSEPSATVLALTRDGGAAR